MFKGPIINKINKINKKIMRNNPFQTNSKNYVTFDDAYNDWKNDKTIYVISFNRKHYYAKIKEELWIQKSEDKLCSLSEKYKNANGSDVYWIEQVSSPNDLDLETLFKKKLPQHEYLEEYNIGCFRKIFTNDDFVEFGRKYDKR